MSRLISLKNKSIFQKGTIGVNCQESITKGIIITKSRSKVWTCDKYISDTCARENVIEGLKNISEQKLNHLAYIVYELGVQQV